MRSKDSVLDFFIRDRFHSSLARWYILLLSAIGRALEWKEVFEKHFPDFLALSEAVLILLKVCDFRTWLGVIWVQIFCRLPDVHMLS
jgi:hypothetical protein